MFKVKIDEEVRSAGIKTNDFVEKDDIVLIIGEYKLCIKKDKLFDIAPIFKNYFSEEFADIVELSYINSNILFNDILQPYLIQGKLPTITEKIFPECIIQFWATCIPHLMKVIVLQSFIF